MNRRSFITLIGGAAAAWPLVARAQQPDRVRQIGVLVPFDENDPDVRATIGAFVETLQGLGWIDGRNIRIEYRFTADRGQLMTLAKELVELRPELIVARSSPVVVALLKQTQTVPIVFTQVVDAVRQGFVASLARPGGNVTGFTNFEPDMGGKWLQTLKEVAPHTDRVAVIFNPEMASYVGYFLNLIESAAASLAVTAIAAPMHDATELERAIPTFVIKPNGSMIVVPDAFTARNRELIISLSLRHRLPAIFPFRFYATTGGLISYGSNPVDGFRQVATYVDRLLKGAKPADLPVQTPTKFELVINLKTAKALGLEVPPMLLARADEVIE